MFRSVSKKLGFVCCLLSVAFFSLLPSPVLASTLSLSPGTGSFGKGCSFSVDVVLDTQNIETNGTDAILQYDPQQVTATNIAPGKIYADFPGNNIDNSAGKVSIFALAPSNAGFTGKGTVATVSFMTNASASASLSTINFDFDPNDITNTTDSNVIEKSDLKDSLQSVSNGSYTIDPNASGCSAAAKTVTTAATTASTLPDSGITEPTWIVGSMGALFLAFGLFGIKKFR